MCGLLGELPQRANVNTRLPAIENPKSRPISSVFLSRAVYHLQERLGTYPLGNQIPLYVRTGFAMGKELNCHAWNNTRECCGFNSSSDLQIARF